MKQLRTTIINPVLTQLFPVFMQVFKNSFFYNVEDRLYKTEGEKVMDSHRL